MNRIRSVLLLPPLQPLARQRAIRPPPIRQLVQSRLASTTPSKPPSNHTAFYRTFGRPVAKVVLMAILTYQLVYYTWTRLEQKEIRAEVTDTIAKLEARIEALEKAEVEKKA